MTTTPVSPRSSSRTGRARLCALLALLGCLLAAASTSFGTGRAGAAAGGVRPGHGVRAAAGDFIGFYTTADGRTIYCLSPRKGVPRTVSLHAVARYGSLDAARTAALAYALATWGDARTDRDAAVESQVLNTLAGNTSDVARRFRSLPSGLRSTVAAHVRQAGAERGPYTVALHLPAPLTPGRSGVGEVRVRDAGGHLLTGATVGLAHGANVSTPRTVRTDGRGVGRFRYTVTDVGEVTITATATALPSTQLLSSSPRPGEQRMVSWQTRVRARAGTRFRAVPNGFSHDYDCSAVCAGHPVVRLQACAVASSYASRVVYRVGADVVVVPFGPNRARSCRVTRVTASDGDRISASWQFRTAHGWSTPIAAPGTLTVDCPAVPAVGVTMSYDCTRATVTIGLAQRGADGSWVPLVNAGTHRTVLVVAGARAARIEAGHGARAVYTADFACGTHAVLTARAGVQRAGGGWNYGTAATVTTP